LDVAAMEWTDCSTRLNEVIRSKPGVTADTAQRLAKLLKTEGLWMHFHNASGLWQEKRAMRRSR